MDLEVIRFLLTNKKKTKTTLHDDDSKQVQDILKNISKKSDDLIVELNKSISEVEKMQNEFGNHSTITARINSLNIMKETAKQIKELSSTLLIDKNNLKYDDLKTICVIEYSFYSLSSSINYFDTSDSSITSVLGRLLGQFVERHNDENIDKRIKEIFEQEKHFEKMCVEFSQMVYYLKQLQKFIVEKEIIKTTKNERIHILESLKSDFNNYSEWIIKHNIEIERK